MARKAATPAPPRKAATPKRAAPAAKATRTRRTPYELVQELRTRREELEASFTAKLNKLDDKIRQLEQRHGDRIKISQLLESKTPAEIAKEFEDIKRQQAILRKAMKRANN